MGWGVEFRAKEANCVVIMTMDVIVVIIVLFIW